MSKLVAFLAGHRSFLVLVAMAIVAGGLWVRGEYAIADRDRIVATSDGICAAAASSWIPAGAEDAEPGKVCRAAVADLASFKAKVIADSNRALVAGQAARADKSEKDLNAAIAAANRTASAARRMEEANAKIAPDDRVDGDWFARLNDLAGLRP
jgi:hypothetical protein